jgi:hypothetical protein
VSGSAENMTRLAKTFFWTLSQIGRLLLGREHLRRVRS